MPYPEVQRSPRRLPRHAVVIRRRLKRVGPAVAGRLCRLSALGGLRPSAIPSVIGPSPDWHFREEPIHLWAATQPRSLTSATTDHFLPDSARDEGIASPTPRRSEAATTDHFSLLTSHFSLVQGPRRDWARVLQWASPGYRPTPGRRGGPWRRCSSRHSRRGRRRRNRRRRCRSRC